VVHTVSVDAFVELVDREDLRSERVLVVGVEKNPLRDGVPVRVVDVLPASTDRDTEVGVEVAGIRAPAKRDRDSGEGEDDVADVPLDAVQTGFHGPHDL